MSDHQPGPELDALIAEKVFHLNVVGLARVWSPDGSPTFLHPEEDHEGVLRPCFVEACGCDDAPWLRTEDDFRRSFPNMTPEELTSTVALLNDEDVAEFARDKASWGHHHHCLEAVPAYSTDNGAALSVLEDFKRRQLRVKLIGEDWYDGGTWHCEIAVNQLGDSFHTANAETAAHAIRLAALKAVGGV
ncbi:MAG: hypothetical protein EPN91_09370 [Salinibacterium sp.]|nr:MAG: hypothetical protein EPN91_09370 [Salinibacterium sp.]